MEKLFKKGRRAVALILAVFMAASLCACGGGKKTSSNDTKNCVFSYEEMSLSEEVDSVIFTKDGFYGIKYIYSDVPATPEAKDVEVEEVEETETATEADVEVAEVNEAVDENGARIETNTIINFSKELLYEDLIILFKEQLIIC